MVDERWQQIERLYHDALALSPDTRQRFLDDSCGNDRAMLDEIQSLLQVAGDTGGFLEGPALNAAARDLIPDSRGDLVGRQIGGYRIDALIGAGGMGDVYRAHDLRLDRDVALKILSASPASGAVDLRRFEEEARFASGLNHPNIVTIYGVAEAGAAAYIAMELVVGRTLRQVIGVQSLPVAAALDLAVQLADALAAAHERGIIHRDLKPENVMVTAEGLLKVLDFGIAKRDHTNDPAPSGDEEPTTAGSMTEDGVILGTVGYMSPEQATGRPASVQSDQFSFGVILYELLSGRRAFDRATRAETLAAIIHEAPLPLTCARTESAARLVDRCLEKDPRARFPSTRALASEVRRVRDGLVAAEQFQGLSRRRAIWLGAAASATAIAGLAAWRFWPSGGVRSLAILPFANPLKDDGTELLCDGITQILIRQLGAVPTLSVMAAATVFTFKGRGVDARTAARQLGVDNVLSGVITRALGRIRVSVELVDAQSGARLWGQEYDRIEADVLAIQDDIARAIITDGIRLSASERQSLPPNPTDNPAAFEAYLTGLHYLRLQTERGYLAARVMLEEAVRQDPKFALACATLSSTYSTMTIDGWSRPRDAWPVQRQYVARALALDPELPEARVESVTATFFYDRNWSAAERGWTAALQARRNVNQPDLLSHLTLLKWALRRPDALQAARAARSSDPLNPLFRIREADLLLFMGNAGDAERVYETVTAQVPDDPRAYFGLAEARRRQGRFDLAIQARHKAQELNSDGPLPPNHPLSAVFESARGEDGYRAIEHVSARLQLDELDARIAAGQYASPLDFARMYAALGDAARTFPALDAAFEDNSAGLVFLNVDPAWNSVRADPRFAAAVRRANLP